MNTSQLLVARPGNDKSAGYCCDVDTYEVFNGLVRPGTNPLAVQCQKVEPEPSAQIPLNWLWDQFRIRVGKVTEEILTDSEALVDQGHRDHGTSLPKQVWSLTQIYSARFLSLEWKYLSAGRNTWETFYNKNSQFLPEFPKIGGFFCLAMKFAWV